MNREIHLENGDVAITASVIPTARFSDEIQLEVTAPQDWTQNQLLGILHGLAMRINLAAPANVSWSVHVEPTDSHRGRVYIDTIGHSSRTAKVAMDLLLRVAAESGFQRRGRQTAKPTRLRLR